MLKKKEFAAVVAEKLGVSTTKAYKLLDVVEDAVLECIKEGKLNDFRFCGVRFRVVNVPEKTRRNPKTGEQITVPAHKAVKVTKTATLKRLFDK